MRCIIQRVNRASIVINGKSGGQIGKGLLVLCAFSDGDDEKTVDYCVEKSQTFGFSRMKTEN